MTKYATKEELDEEYRSIDRRRKVPEGLSMGARESYERDLARLEGRDTFEFSITIPSWVPDDKKHEYLDRLWAAVKESTHSITDEACERYHTNRVKVM